MTEATVTYAEARMLVASFSALEPNWDSYGAPPLSPSVLGRAVIVLDAFERAGIPVPFPVPTSKGGIAFEWSGDHEGWCLGVEP